MRKVLRQLHRPEDARRSPRRPAPARRGPRAGTPSRRPARPARRSPRGWSRRARRSRRSSADGAPALVRGIDQVAIDHRVAGDVVDAVARQLAPAAGDRRAPDLRPLRAEQPEHLARGEGQHHQRPLGRRAGAAEHAGAAGALHPPERSRRCGRRARRRCRCAAPRPPGRRDHRRRVHRRLERLAPDGRRRWRGSSAKTSPKPVVTKSMPPASAMPPPGPESGSCASGTRLARQASAPSGRHRAQLPTGVDGEDEPAGDDRARSSAARACCCPRRCRRPDAAAAPAERRVRRPGRPRAPLRWRPGGVHHRRGGSASARASATAAAASSAGAPGCARQAGAARRCSRPGRAPRPARRRCAEIAGAAEGGVGMVVRRRPVSRPPGAASGAERQRAAGGDDQLPRPGAQRLGAAGLGEHRLEIGERSSRCRPPRAASAPAARAPAAGTARRGRRGVSRVPCARSASIVGPEQRHPLQRGERAVELGHRAVARRARPAPPRRRPCRPAPPGCPPGPAAPAPRPATAPSASSASALGPRRRVGLEQSGAERVARRLGPACRRALSHSLTRRAADDQEQRRADRQP